MCVCQEGGRFRLLGVYVITMLKGGVSQKLRYVVPQGHRSSSRSTRTRFHVLSLYKRLHALRPPEF